jgi:phosphoglucosamine mutase
MTAEIALKLGMAAGCHFVRGDHRHRVIIGKDTRLSGYMIEPALTAGLIAMGMNVVLVGPLPTPAISMLTRSMRADLGVMISASHNPYHDNGVNFLDPMALNSAMKTRPRWRVWCTRIYQVTMPSPMPWGACAAWKIA